MSAFLGMYRKHVLYLCSYVMYLCIVHAWGEGEGGGDGRALSENWFNLKKFSQY